MLKAPLTVAKAKAKLMNFFDVKRILIDSLNSVCYTMALRLKISSNIPWKIDRPFCKKEQIEQSGNNCKTELKQEKHPKLIADRFHRFIRVVCISFDKNSRYNKTDRSSNNIDDRQKGKCKRSLHSKRKVHFAG